MSSTCEHRGIERRRHYSGNNSGDTSEQVRSGPSTKVDAASTDAAAVPTHTPHQLPGEADTATSSDSHADAREFAQRMSQHAKDSPPSVTRPWGSSQLTSIQPMPTAGSVNGYHMRQWFQSSERNIACVTRSFTGRHSVHYDPRYNTEDRSAVVVQHRDVHERGASVGHADNRRSNGVHEVQPHHDHNREHSNDNTNDIGQNSNDSD